MKKIIRFITDKNYRFVTLAVRGFYNSLSDEEYLRKMFQAKLGKDLNLDKPVTFNEKIQWLKLHDKKDIYTTMVDKYEVKKYVARIIGEEYIIPTLGVWNSFEEIDFDKLPKRFVLKCTHDSGGIVICKDKNKLNIDMARKKINECLKRNYYWKYREWAYKNVKPRIIAETYMEDAETNELRDYKFFSFDGVTRALFIATDRQDKNQETKFDFFDTQFNHLNLVNGHPNADKLPSKPKYLNLMIELSEKLSKGIPHLRVDFYEVSGKVYFGELTFCHWGGFVPFQPNSWDEIFGSWIKLPNL